MLDMVITGGKVIDGTGGEAFSADVAVKDGRIVELGRVTTPAARRIDADGLAVTPGFVDIHTHFDGQASWDSMLAPSSNNGVTSVVMGNCGVGFAPARPDKHDWLINLLEGVEDIPGTALHEGLSWDWETFPDYLDALSRRRYTMDLGAYLPHAALRTYVMGDRGADYREHPDDADIARMQAITAEALEAGAMGFSTSRTANHKAGDGSNIGTLEATARELLGIAQTLRASGRGLIQLISDAYQSQDEDYVEGEIGLIRSLAETSGRPLAFTLMQSRAVPDRWRRLLGATEEMKTDGLDVNVQVAPRPIGAIASFASSMNPFVETPTYQALGCLSCAERVSALRDPQTRAAILAEFRKGKPSRWNPISVFRMADPVEYDPVPERSIAAEAQRLGRDGIDHMYDVLLEEDCRQILWVASLNFANGGLGAVHEMLTHPNALYGLSDAGAHVATIVDGTFPTTTLTLWGRDGARQGGRIPVGTLVHRYSARNARFVGWHDRGVIAPGYLADINVIDLEALNVAPPRLVNDLPAGGQRFLQAVRGYHRTIKRGAVTVEDDTLTGELPGQLMRGAQKRAA